MRDWIRLRTDSLVDMGEWHLEGPRRLDVRRATVCGIVFLPDDQFEIATLEATPKTTFTCPDCLATLSLSGPG